MKNIKKVLLSVIALIFTIIIITNIFNQAFADWDKMQYGSFATAKSMYGIFNAKGDPRFSGYQNKVENWVKSEIPKYSEDNNFYENWGVEVVPSSIARSYPYGIIGARGAICTGHEYESGSAEKSIIIIDIDGKDIRINGVKIADDKYSVVDNEEVEDISGNLMESPQILYNGVIYTKGSTAKVPNQKTDKENFSIKLTKKDFYKLAYYINYNTNKGKNYYTTSGKRIDLLPVVRYFTVYSGLVNGQAVTDAIKNINFEDEKAEEYASPENKQKNIRARMVIGQPKGSGGQDIAIFAAYKDETYTNPGKLKIHKVENDTNEAMAGIKFTITGPNSFNQELVTDENGNTETLEELDPGEYRIVEQNPNIYGYQDELYDEIVILESNDDKIIEITNTKQTGNLYIEKRDADNKDKKLAGITFNITGASGSKNEGKYVKIADAAEEEGFNSSKNTCTGTVHIKNMEFVDELTKATQFITDSKGEIKLYNILKGDYNITETAVGNNTQYNIDDDYIKWESEDKKPKTQINEQEEYNNSPTEETNSENANNIKQGEGRTASITVYGRNSKNTPDTKESIPEDENEYDYVIFNNEKKYIKIAGYAFEDIGYEKDLIQNNLYKDLSDDIMDKKLPDVKVELHMIKDTGEDQILATKTTDENGEYLFESYLGENNLEQKIEIAKLNKMYIQFIYNGMIYETTNIVYDIDNKIKDNSSHVSEDKELREEFNNRFTTIDNNSDLKYKTSNNVSKLKYTDRDDEDVNNPPISEIKEKFQIRANTTKNGDDNILGIKLTIENIKKSNEDTIKNINLGLRKRELPDIAVMKELHNVTLSINGKSHTYEYNQRNNKTNQEEYVKELYTKNYQGKQRYSLNKDNEGNIKYVEDNEKGDYIFDNAKNEYTYIGLYNVGVKFGEKYGNMSYSRAIYESDYMYDDKTNKDNNLKVYVIYQISMRNQANTLSAKVNSVIDYYDNRYDLIEIGENINEKGQIIDRIDENKINTEHLNDVPYKKTTIEIGKSINAQEEGNIYVKFQLNRNNYSIHSDNGGDILDNIAEINSYTTTLNGKAYGGVDRDSQPGSVKIELDNQGKLKKDTFEDDTDKAPSFKLEYTKEPRAVEGIVFLDKTSNELRIGQTRLGDGEYKDEEDLGIKGVEVTLMKNDEEIATVYNKNEETTIQERWKEAKVESEDKGLFKIEGFVPGEYILKYTWGNKTYIVNEDGTIKNIITIQEYKGTTVDKTRWKENEINRKWYKNEMPRYSDAIDDWQRRQNIDSGEHPEIKTMESTTCKMDFEIEKTDGTFSEYNAENMGYDIKNVDFGIVERARQEIKLDKKIKTIQISLGSDQPLIDATINDDGSISGQAKGLTYMPPSDSTLPNNGLVKFELDPELTQGTKLDVKYNLKAINNSEKDYLSEDFYEYGIEKGEEVTITPKIVIDYLDNSWAFISNKNPGWNVKTLDEIKGKIDETVYKDKDSMINNKTIIYTENFNKKLTPEEFLSNELVVSKQLGNAEEIVLDNESEIIEIEKKGGAKLSSTPGNYIPGLGHKESDDDLAETIIITPNTGSNLNFIIPALIGIVALIILGVGIVLIKKKTL